MCCPSAEPRSYRGSWCAAFGPARLRSCALTSAQEKAEQYDKLRAVLCDLKMFVLLYPAHKFDICRYWRVLEKTFKSDPVAVYAQSLRESHNFPTDVITAEVFYKGGCFLEDIAKFEGTPLLACPPSAF